MDTSAPFEKMSVEDIEAQLVSEGQRLLTLRTAKEAAAKADEIAYAKYKAENTAVIEAAKKARETLEQAESNLRLLEVEHYRRTGSKRFGEAYEIRLMPTPQYDPERLLGWLLSAPYDMAKEFLTVDTKPFETWLKDNVDDNGAPPDMPFCPTLPALVVNKPQAAIISSGLPKLADIVFDVNGKMATPPTITELTAGIEKVGEPVSFYTAPIEEIVEVVNGSAKAVASLPVAEQPFDALGDIPF